jgi:ribonuclease R
MQQAKYDVDPIGHYGLAADYYSHFTSPIRRYPDLILHRQIHYYSEVGADGKARKRWQKKLPEIAEHSSRTERRAVDAERETDELKKTEFMEGKVGEEFEGIITSVTGFGMFVQLPNSVEGLIHISRMDDDYYEFSERGLLMIGSHTGKIFRIGQPIKVKLISVDREQYQIDFEIVEDFAEKGENQKQRNKKAERKNQHKQKRKKKQKKRSRRKKNGR